MNDAPKFNEDVRISSEDDSMTELPGRSTDTEEVHTRPNPSSPAPATTPAPAPATIDAHTDALVMMVDDEPINLEVTQIYLEDAGYSRFVSTDDPTRTLELLEIDRPDVLLLDLMMPGMSGFDILREMQEKNILKDVPAIVLTSSHDSGTKLKALELGATDFLSKPVDPSELTLRVRNTLAVKAYRDRLANYDLLTGLPNRRTFLDRLAWALQHAQEYDKSGAMLHIDIDGFKQINDALGPALGDDLLQIIAVRMSRCLRDTDTLEGMEITGPQPSLSRLAGDEFAVLLPELAHTNYAAEIAERVLDAIAKPVSLSGHDLRITCSIGISTFPADGLDSDAIVKNAGVAMHHAKGQKVHSFQFYASELNASALHQLNLGHQLRDAIERDELRLYYQPTSDAHTGAICGCEALIRWQHPQRGLLAPDVFIPLAEETGLIDEIGEWVIRTACNQSNEWRVAGLPAYPISINVSSHQFRQQRLALTLREILEETGADPSMLIVEITEGVLLENAENNIKILEDIRSIGIKLSMDDFGTGYSSLSYLNSFPLDELKVDRCFVEQIKEPGDKSAIIRAIIAMAHSLGLTVVAEGVETPLQLEYLQSQGCDEYQGFIVSKPVPPGEFAARFLGVSSSTVDSNELPVDIPTISGIAAMDQVLSADTSALNNVDDSSAFSYQWLRDNIAIGGASESTYTPYGADVGKRISVRVSFTDAQGATNGPLTSMPTAEVVSANDARKGAENGSGSATGKENPTISFTLDDDDAAEQPQPAGVDDLGGAIDETAGSEPVELISITDEAPPGIPGIGGTANEGQVLCAETSNISDADDQCVFSYQWLRNNDVIDGATASIFTLDETDVGTRISVKVSFTNTQGAAEGPFTSLQTAEVNVADVGDTLDSAESLDGTTPDNVVPTPSFILEDNDAEHAPRSALDELGDVNSVTPGSDPKELFSIASDVSPEIPGISGTAKEGQGLCAETSHIRGVDERCVFSYHWLRDKKAIDGATASNYTLDGTDVGARISVQVSFTDPQGTANGPFTSMQTVEVIKDGGTPDSAESPGGTAPEIEIPTPTLSLVDDDWENTEPGVVENPPDTVADVLNSETVQSLSLVDDEPRVQSNITGTVKEG
jgi:diguanylate cyclase (GGDEF)-like protein